MCSNPIRLYFSKYVLDSRDPADSSLSNGFDTVFSLAGKKQKKEKKQSLHPWDGPKEDLGKPSKLCTTSLR
jgi:hypothetical protein